MDGEIAICGGGIVGSSLALALAREGLSVLLFDKPPAPARGSAGSGRRAFALSLSSCRLLEALGLSDLLRMRGQAVRSVRISDGLAGQGAGPAVLGFDAGEIQEDSLGCVIEDRHLRTGLIDLLKHQPGITHLTTAAVSDCRVEPSGVTVLLTSGRQYRARVVAGCDGRNGTVARCVDPPRLMKDYGQSALVCTIEHELPHEGVAHQFFMPPGPLAILPLPGCASSVVWTESTTEVDRLISLPEAGFISELQPRFGDFLGRLELAGNRFAWPLTLSLAESIAAPRLVLVGEAAHGFHPLAGQGLNVGLRDAAALAEILVQATRRGEDAGILAVLRRYQEWRRVDAVSLAVATDFFNWIYSNDMNFLRTIRGMGMYMVSEAPWLKRSLIKEAAGLSGSLPRLVSGKPL